MPWSNLQAKLGQKTTPFPSKLANLSFQTKYTLSEGQILHIKASKVQDFEINEYLLEGQ